MISGTQASMYYSMASTYCRAGNTGKALEYLVKTLNTGIGCADKIEEDPAFDALRDKETFLSLVKAAHLVDAAQQCQEKGDEKGMCAALREAAAHAPLYAYPSYLLARHLSIRCATEEALAALNEAVRKGFRDFCLIMKEDAFLPLRNTREFQDLLKSPPR